MPYIHLFRRWTAEINENEIVNWRKLCSSIERVDARYHQAFGRNRSHRIASWPRTRGPSVEGGFAMSMSKPLSELVGRPLGASGRLERGKPDPVAYCSGIGVNNATHHTSPEPPPHAVANLIWRGRYRICPSLSTLCDHSICLLSMNRLYLASRSCLLMSISLCRSRKICSHETRSGGAFLAFFNAPREFKWMIFYIFILRDRNIRRR